MNNIRILKRKVGHDSDTNPTLLAYIGTADSLQCSQIIHFADVITESGPVLL